MRYPVYSMHDGVPHKLIAEYYTLGELRKHRQRVDQVELVQIKPRMYLPLHEYLALRRNDPDA
jgi:hypothetical protein